jgi:sirohydrochlorin cobaltochelatase
MSWEKFREQGGGLLIVGHGTRRAEGVKQLLELAREMQAQQPTIPMAPGFLELSQPDIAAALAELHARRVREVLVVPILLFEAGHARSDIPEAVAAACRDWSMTVIGQSTPLGTHPVALQLSHLRFQEALACLRREGCLWAGNCPRRLACRQLSPDPTGRRTIALAMVGRGTSDKTALAAMREFSRRRRALPLKSPDERLLDYCQTGFFAGGSPSVDELLEEVAQQPASTIVIQPHLLFEGELMEQLRQKVDRWQQLHPHQQWLVPLSLGSGRQLAETFLALASERLGSMASSDLAR